jgi:hypothetical protein
MKVSTMRRIGLGIWSHMGAPLEAGVGGKLGGSALRNSNL